MRSCCMQNQIIINQFVDQHPITLYMAIHLASPVPSQKVRARIVRQRFFGSQGVYNPLKLFQCLAATLHSSQITREALGRLNGAHAD